MKLSKDEHWSTSNNSVELNSIQHNALRKKWKKKVYFQTDTLVQSHCDPW